MKDIVFIADFFIPEISREAGELFNEELINFLISSGFNVQKLKSQQITLDFLRNNKEKTFLIGNFVGLSSVVKAELRSGNYKYFLLIHDHPYIKSRNPLTYSNLAAPQSEIINEDFFSKAKAIFAQSKVHAEIIQKNLFLNQIVNLGCNLFSDHSLLLLEDVFLFFQKQPKQYLFSVMESSNKIKGTQEAIKWLQTHKNIIPHLIKSSDIKIFYEELAKTETLVFFPQTYETYSRVFVEAKALGCRVITNKAVGVLSEIYSNKTGLEMIQELRNGKKRVQNIFLDVLESLGTSTHFFIPFISWPKVSLISTFYKGERFIQGYLDAFKNASLNYPGFSELILIDANSPENEKKMLDEFQKNNPELNIKYVRTEDKITQGKAFNIAESISSGEYICVCLIDDRLGLNHFHLVKNLVFNKNIDLVYTDTFVSEIENESYEQYIERHKNIQKSNIHEHQRNSFSKENMIKCLPGPYPVYRKEMSIKNGGWNDDMTHSVDWELWLRCVRNGSSFQKINYFPTAVYYQNPNGMSTSKDDKITKERRICRIFSF